MKGSVYVVDDHKASGEALGEALEDEGYAVEVFFEPAEALARIREVPPAALLTDLRMEGMDGIELLKAAHSVDGDLPVILITAYATIDRAVEATRAGAFAFVTKPVKLPQLLIQVRNAVAFRDLREAVNAPQGQDTIIGRSSALLTALTRGDRAAATSMTVLITGESGTGKELAARRIHDRSDRATSAFVPVNCGAIPETLIEAELFGSVKGAFTGASSDRIGLIESADKGTLFLDEVGELSPAAQVRLLRFLQEGYIRRVGDTRDRQVDVRVIAATHRDLTGESFREDLYYRLNVLPIELPPLRARGGDVLLLFGRCFRQICTQLGREVPSLSPEAIDALRAYRWPGNVRELKNVTDRIAVMSTSETIGLDDLPREISGAAEATEMARLPEGEFDLTGWLESLEETALRRALDQHDGVKARAASALGLERNAFRYKLKKYEIEE